VATTPEQRIEPVAPSLGPIRLPSAFRSLSNRNFRYLWFGQVGSATAMHADMVARSILVYDLTGSSAAVGGVLGARAIPMLIFGLFGGVAADRFDRKRLLMIIQVWSLAMHAVMAALILANLIELWHIYVIAFGLGCGMALNQPVRTSIIPNLVPRSEMTNALTLNSIAINGTRLAGPALIGGLIVLTDVGWAYVWAMSAFVIVLWMTLRIEMPQITGGKDRGNPVSQLLEGFKYIGQNRVVLALVVLGLAPLAIGFAHQTLLPQLVNEFGYETGMIGVIMSVGAIGGLGGGIVIASKKSISGKGLVMLGSSVVYGLSLLGFALAAQIDLPSALKLSALVFPFIIAIGVSQTSFRAMNTTILMETTPDHLRGRIISATLLDTAIMPAAGLAAGLAADEWGVWAGYTALGAGCLAVIAMVVLIYPRVRSL
jgi:MFS family permease